MDNNEVKNRNINLDMYRGIAILMVVFLHIVSDLVAEATTTFVFNFIWVLQMPIFFVISGYVNKYTRTKSFVSFAFKRTCSYLVPWIAWTFIIKGFILQKQQLFDLPWLFNNMDSGYWFLFSLWMMSIAFGACYFFASRFKKSYLVFCFAYIGIMSFYALLAVKFGLSFLGMKFTLYYMLFYFIGYSYGYWEDKIESLKFFNKSREVVIAFLVLIFILLLSRYNFAVMQDTITNVIIRFACSLLGCIAFFSLIKPNAGTLFGKICTWFGTHSLEVYVIHLPFMGTLIIEDKVALYSIRGLVTVFVSYVLLLTVSFLIAYALNNNTYTRKVLCGK